MAIYNRTIKASFFEYHVGNTCWVSYFDIDQDFSQRLFVTPHNFAVDLDEFVNGEGVEELVSDEECEAYEKVDFKPRGNHVYKGKSSL